MKDLKDLGQIGAGGFGTVNKMLHVRSELLMAVKIIRVSVDEADQRQVVMDLGVIRKASYKHIVTFYGALFYEVKITSLYLSPFWPTLCYPVSFSIFSLLRF